MAMIRLCPVLLISNLTASQRLSNASLRRTLAMGRGINGLEIRHSTTAIELSVLYMKTQATGVSPLKARSPVLGKAWGGGAGWDQPVYQELTKQ